MAALDAAGGGVAWYAETVDDASRIFAEEFSSLVELVAQNISVEIRPTDQVEMIGILNDYPSVGLVDGVQLQLGDAFAGQRRASCSSSTCRSSPRWARCSSPRPCGT